MRFVMSQVDWDRVDGDVVRECWQKVHDPDLQVQFQGFGRGKLWKEGAATFALLVRGKDAVEAGDLNFGEIAFKKAILRFVRELRECPGFENAHIIKFSHQAEVRATRRIGGDYVLTKEDCVQGRKFPDAVAVTPPRSQHLGKGKALSYAPPGTQIFHGIPLRCLLPRNLEGILAAGRCISTEFDTLQGHLSIPGCMLVGQAAGVAAALSARGKVTPRNLDVKTVQALLVEMGADLKEGISV